MPEYTEHDNWVRIRVDPKFSEFLQDSRIFSTVRPEQPCRWKQNIHVSFAKTTTVEPYSAVYMGELLYGMGSFSFVTTPFKIPAYGLSISFGRYCSIGGGAEIVGPAHPLTAVSTATPFFDGATNYTSTYFKDAGITEFPFVKRPVPKGPPIIGHDVWFGGDVCLNTGVKIGNGAVVAAKAVVTRHVPDYAIVGGNPARIIRYRFPEEIIVELQKIQPWNYSMKDLAQFDVSNIEKFISEFAQAKDQLFPYAPPRAHLWGAYQFMHGLK